MVNLEQIDLDSYIAGFFDGEGYIRVYVKDRKYIEISPMVRITQNAKSRNVFEIMKNYLRSVGIKSTIHYEIREGKKEDVVKLNINGWYNIKKFLELIYPYSIVKIPQIKIMLEEILPRIKPMPWLGNKYGKYSKKKTIEIMYWVDKMNALKGKRGTSGTKYTEQYFRDLWGIKD